MAQSISQEAIGATGLPGATAASRHAGATTSGAPTSGTFAVGDFIVDQSGAMYVCTASGTPGTWQLSGVSVNENIAGKNFVINGGMDIWQRGTSFALTTYNVYTADRWSCGNGSGITISQVSSGLTGFQYAMRAQRNSGVGAVTSINLFNMFETKNSIPLAGQTISLSFWARAGANFSGTGYNIHPQVQTGTGTDQNAWGGWTGSAYSIDSSTSLTTSWQKFTYTGVCASNITQAGIFFYYVPTGTAGANDYFDITGVQLEIAPQATSFSRAGGSIGGELALCQRYYWQNPSINYAYITPMAFNSSSAGLGVLQLPVPMRTSPSATFTGSFLLNPPNAAVSSFSLDRYSPNTIGFTFSGSSSGANGFASVLLNNSSGTGVIAVSAEL
jgi:hypothetical protein